MKKDYIVYFFSLLVFVFLVFMLCQKCSKTEPIKVNTKDIRNNIDDIDSVISIVEPKKDNIVKKIKPLKSIAKKKASYFVPQIGNCTFDSVKYINRIDSLLSLCNKLDTVYQIDSTLIKLLKSQVKQYQNLDTIQQKQIDSLINQPKGRFKAFCTGVGIGFIIGSIVR